MYIDSATITTIAGVMSALIAIGAAAYKVIKWFQAQEKQTKDIEKLREQEKKDIKGTGKTGYRGYAGRIVPADICSAGVSERIKRTGVQRAGHGSDRESGKAHKPKGARPGGINRK